MNINGFHVDVDSSDDHYLFIDANGITIVIKREAEGIIVDLYPLHVTDEPIASTWALFSEAVEQEQ